MLFFLNAMIYFSIYDKKVKSFKPEIAGRFLIHFIIPALEFLILPI